jgi:hypothetical protein
MRLILAFYSTPVAVTRFILFSISILVAATTSHPTCYCTPAAVTAPHPSLPYPTLVEVTASHHSLSFSPVAVPILSF